MKIKIELIEDYNTPKGELSFLQRELQSVASVCNSTPNLFENTTIWSYAIQATPGQINQIVSYIQTNYPSIQFRVV